jgi:glyoxylase-like metal-dependent hydrolase (beta-lactamase superfamily II)
MSEAQPPIARNEFYKLSLGEVEITAISDGCLQVPLANFPSADAGSSSALLAGVQAAPGKVPIPVNCFLIRTEKNVMLVDTGAGALFGPAAGHLIRNLRLAGCRPDQIDTVLMTHLHIDHVGGLVTDDAPTFSNAELVVAQREIEYWQTPGFPEAAPERQRSSANAATRSLELYRGRISTFAGGAALTPRIRTAPLPGHTPGHTGFIFDGGERQLFLWGDIIHSSLLQFAEPDWYYAADVDRDAAAKTRIDVFSRTAQNSSLVAGMHLPFPAIGHVERRGSKFIFRPLSSSAIAA